MQQSRDEICSDTLVEHGVVVQGSRPRLQCFYQSKKNGSQQQMQSEGREFLAIGGMQCQATFIPLADTLK
jgi:hypothetical protein